MKGFTCPAILTGITHKVDKSLSVRFTTNELDHDEKIKISEHHMTMGWLLFAENPVQEEEIPKENSDVSPKTQSERLRNVLFVLWNQKGKEGEFKDFYRTKTEEVITHFKNKLDE